MQRPTEKRPRHYAAEIVALRTRDERAAALAAAPERLRRLIREHVVDYFAKRKYLRGAA